MHVDFFNKMNGYILHELLSFAIAVVINKLRRARRKGEFVVYLVDKASSANGVPSGSHLNG